MPAEGQAVEGLTALRKALLSHHDALAAAWRLPFAAARAGMRLDRFKLSWLVAPWGMLSMLISFPRAMSRVATEERRLVGLYVQASGRDPDVSRADVDRIQAQLMPLDERSTHWLRPEVAGSRRADRAELEATAAALLAYYLAGRQTDDALLAEAQAAYAAYEHGQQASTAVLAERGMRAASRYEKAHRAQDAAAMARYVTAWRRWIDHAGAGTDAGTQPPAADLRPADRPAEDRAAPREVWMEQLVALLRDEAPTDWDGVEERVRRRLARFKLAWLAVPAALVNLIISIPRLIRTAIRDQVRSEGLYQRLSGKDADVARAELGRIRFQLLYLGSCPPEDPGSSPGGSGLAGPAARAAATRALLGYFLADRPTDDALLAQTQAAYAALEQQLEERDVRAGCASGGRGRRRRRAHEAAAEQRQDAAQRRYCQAWRQWLEQQPADDDFRNPCREATSGIQPSPEG